MKTIYLRLLVFSTILFFASCETVDLDQTTDPSQPGAGLYNPYFAFNYIQLELADFVDSGNSFSQRVTRQMAMTGGDTYQNAFEPVNFDRNWTTGYGILNAIKTFEPNAVDKDGRYMLGASKVIKAYVLMSLVDFYGDVPLSEALNPNILNPKFDRGADVYKNALSTLDEAITILSGNDADAGASVIDLYYGRAKSKWITLAKTLKLRAYNTARLAGADIGVADIGVAISDLIAAGDIIDTSDEDFKFQYGTNRDLPNSRHPLYNDQYELGGGAYIGNYMFWTVTEEKDKAVDFDPRTAFYFYKQGTVAASASTVDIPGRTRPVHYNNPEYASFYNPDAVKAPYTVSNWITAGGTLPGGGYLGRDHGNNTGIPPDSELRSVGGVYPIGGKFNINVNAASTVQHSGTDGALGAGIMPMMMSSYVQFIKAEAILKAGVPGSAKTELLGAIEKSIDRVSTPINNYPVLTAANQTSIANKKTAYLNFISSEYDALINDDQRLELIMKEYYIALWGNGIEAYNNYRRTGYPSNFQPTLEPNSGPFYNAALYPAAAVSNNPNTPGNNRTRRVFWDKAALNLH